MRWAAMALAVLAMLLPGVDSRAQGNSQVDIREWRVPWEGTQPRDPYAAGPDTVWFVGQRGDYLARLTPSTGEFTKVDLEEGAGPHNLIVDDDGNVWFAANLKGYIGRYDPTSGKLERIAMPDPKAYDPHTLAFDAAGDIWFTVQGGNFVGRLTPETREIDLIDVPTQHARPYGIDVAANGMVWVALVGTNKLASVDPETMELTEHTLPREDARPRRLEAGMDGRVWYGDFNEGRLGVYDPSSGEFEEWDMPSGADARPYGLVLDANQRLWVVETGADPNMFVGFDTQGERFLGSTPVPSGGGSVRHMDFDPAGSAVWFGTDAGTIGRAVVVE